MTSNTIYLRPYDWILRVFFDVKPQHVYHVIPAMEDSAISSRIIKRATSLIRSGNRNYGFAATNSEIKETVIVIGECTSREEFLNTLEHEIRHLVDDIAECYNITKSGEEVGYITGTVNTLLTQNIDRYFCECNDAN